MEPWITLPGPGFAAATFAAIIRVLTPLVLAVEGLRPADIARLVMMNYRVAIRIGRFPRVQLRQVVK